MRNLFLASLAFSAFAAAALAQSQPAGSAQASTTVDASKLPPVVVITGGLATLAGAMQVCHPPVATDIRDCMKTVLVDWSSLTGQNALSQTDLNSLQDLWKERFLDAYQKQQQADPAVSCEQLTTQMEASTIWGVCYGTAPDPVTGGFPSSPPPSSSSPDANGDTTDDGGGIRLQ